MKSLRTAFGFLLVSAVAWAAQGAPVNTTCPVKTGTPVKPNITEVYKGKTVAFC